MVTGCEGREGGLWSDTSFGLGDCVADATITASWGQDSGEKCMQVLLSADLGRDGCGHTSTHVYSHAGAPAQLGN
jgi:hypothetical protein